MKSKLFLIDGNSFCYRAYYAIQNLSTSKGEPTNAIYGVITMLRKIVEEDKPDYLAVCFDRKEPTFRHDKFEDYKAHRKPMPDDLVEQMPKIKEVLEAYRIPLFEKAGYEADDILGTLAEKAAKEKYDVYILTGDKDALQLVNSSIRVYNVHKDSLIYDAQKVKERFEGLGPDQIIDLMALMGDASDNIPGVPKVGEKTALELMKQFGSLENIYKHLDQVKKDSIRKSLQENRKLADLSRELATIDTRVPIEFKISDMKMKAPDEEKLKELFRRFEFRTLLKDVTPTAEAGTEKRHYHLVDTKKKLAELIEKLESAKKFSFDTETTSSDAMIASLVGLSFSFKEKEAYYIPCSHTEHEGKGLDRGEVLEVLRPVLENEKLRKFGQNIKYDWMVLKRHGIQVRGLDFDTMIASYLINPAKAQHNLDDISLEYLNVKKITTKSLLGEGKKAVTMDKVPLEQVAEYAAEDADCVFRLEKKLRPILEDHSLVKLFEETEMPLLEVLARMEMNGVKLDCEFLGKLSARLEKDLAGLTQKIYKIAGEEFNINSTKQLAEILFEKLKLPTVKKTKTGFSTDVSVLEKLAETHEVPKLLLEYREKNKLKSTYVDALPEMADAEGLIHTSFNQTVTATGRLSSSDPNLQNIPIKSELGREIRKAFVPRSKKCNIISADYSQIELRLLAHFSEDPNLSKAFREGLDVHKYTASLLYGVKEDAVTREMRYAAKTVNFSIIYGKTPFGLSKDLGISIGEADLFIQNYFKRYSHVKEYLESQKEMARAKGYVTTLLGRRAYFPEIKSSNVMMRQFAERAAINAPLQGSAADLVKLAMLAIDRDLIEKKMTTLMILQVHDELVFDAPEAELDSVSELIKNRMEHAVKLRVPLEIGLKIGHSWYEGDEA
ncbi:MAG: DNA polymerase I [Candidatus Omnitrophica bacterium]|nr:DNA polymerase I [Candidatus Omnitrophota bacterium]